MVQYDADAAGDGLDDDDDDDRHHHHHHHRDRDVERRDGVGDEEGWQVRAEQPFHQAMPASVRSAHSAHDQHHDPMMGDGSSGVHVAPALRGLGPEDFEQSLSSHSEF
eukprot:3169209-Rhodomonas_salina.1